jgi:hypothetical protein
LDLAYRLYPHQILPGPWKLIHYSQRD